MKIFTDRLEGEKSEKLQPHSLLEFLKPYSDATLLFLENLVHDKNSTVSNNPRMVRIWTLRVTHYVYNMCKPSLDCIAQTLDPSSSQQIRGSRGGLLHESRIQYLRKDGVNPRFAHNVYSETAPYKDTPDLKIPL